jgi:hypothetical protein
MIEVLVDPGGAIAPIFFAGSAVRSSAKPLAKRLHLREDVIGSLLDPQRRRAMANEKGPSHWVAS